MKTPVLLIIFNRFDTTFQVLDSLRAARVPRLYIYSDGPRADKPGEADLLMQVQQQVLNAVDWECSVTTFFQKENIGPRIALGNAISTFFEHEEEGIILEHDCVPNASFYTFCESLLEHYRDDERIMHISGDNFQFGRWRGEGSYYFSRITHIWGFATWRRAWKHYDVTMKGYPEFLRQQQLEKMFPHTRERRLWKDILDRIYSGDLQSWDYQWTFAVWQANGLAVLPNVNLVANVGFDASALNTTNPNHRLARMQTGALGALVHPKIVEPNLKADTWSMLHVFYPTYVRYGWQVLKKIFGKGL